MFLVGKWLKSSPTLVYNTAGQPQMVIDLHFKTPLQWPRYLTLIEKCYTIMWFTCNCISKPHPIQGSTQVCLQMPSWLVQPFCTAHHVAFSALTLLVGLLENHLASKKIEWWGAGVVICLERSANDLHMVQLMPLSSIISCFIKIQNGSTFLVPAYPGCPGKGC